MRQFLLSLTCILLLAPNLCEAKTTAWNMKGVTKLEGWNHKGFSSIELTPEGLLMKTENQGQLARTGVRHEVDTITITFTSPTGANGIFFWQPKNMEGNSAFHIPITFDRSVQPTKIVLDLSQIPEWEPRSKLIGFNINPGAQLTLQHIELAGPGLIDNIIYPVQSFFTLDVVHAYTVNFLWGPRMVTSADAVKRVFAQVPPNGDSWNEAFYGILALCALVLFARKYRNATRVAPALLLVFATLWVLYDLRMGAEVLSYARTDMKTWWSKPMELKDFRDRGSFTAFTKVAPEYTNGEDKYVLVTPSGWPYFNSLHYETYPAQPVSPSEATDDMHVWMVFDMNDVYVSDEGRIVQDGQPISPPGEVVMPFEPGAFIFRTNP